MPYYHDNSYLTPFGKIVATMQKDNVSSSKGTLVIKQSLEDSIINNQIKTSDT